MSVIKEVFVTDRNGLANIPYLNTVYVHIHCIPIRQDLYMVQPIIMKKQHVTFIS